MTIFDMTGPQWVQAYGLAFTNPWFLLGATIAIAGALLLWRYDAKKGVK